MNIKKKIIADIVTSVVSAACAVVCAVLTGCKLSVGSLQLKDFSSEITIPSHHSTTNTIGD